MMSRKYSDEEILDKNFPDIRMKEKDMRPLRHKYYRNKVQEEKNKKALVSYNETWVAKLWNLWHNK
jgi:hypothetical protein